ncbi:hypothetical protein LCGC14_2199020 [marine sediment metagenome]|uniref:Uncharacterized protein n=1 Tax=marine sediment metagenome TaxID=412755 RepID=A0A0F9DH93_9ZZZZ
MIRRVGVFWLLLEVVVQQRRRGVMASKKKTSETATVRPLPDTADARLRYFGRLSSSDQQSYLIEINKAFLEFLGTDPYRDEFVEVMGGVLITSLMLWTALKAHR